MPWLRLEFRASADADLLTIFENVFGLGRSAETARRLTRRCERIGNVLSGGRARDELSPGLRTVPFERSAVMTYIVEGDCVRITKIFHCGQDCETLYRDELAPGAGE